MSAFFRAPVGHYELVSPEMLYSSTTDGPTPCIIAAGTEQKYNEEHIPGARYFAVPKILIQTQAKTRQLVHPLDFTEYARSLGIYESCKIIIYHQDSETIGPSLATWMWWVFKAYGYPYVSVLNGGLSSWQQKSYTVTQELPAPRRGDFLASWNPGVMVPYEDLYNLIQDELGSEPSYQLLDARAREFFSGAQKAATAKLGGHIPTAINVPVYELYENGKVRDFDKIRSILTGRGVKPDVRTIVYGNNELEASMLFFILSQLDGYSSMQLYDGSWEEWSSKQAGSDKPFVENLSKKLL